MSNDLRYVVQAVTFGGGRISRVLREEVVRSEYAAEMAASCMKMDIALVESGASIYVNDELRWSNYLAPGAPHDLRTACRTV
ncbi:MAG: hypothetical protein VW475_09090 [Curvibacter sp.]